MKAVCDICNNTFRKRLKVACIPRRVLDFMKITDDKGNLLVEMPKSLNIEMISLKVCEACMARWACKMPIIEKR